MLLPVVLQKIFWLQLVGLKSLVLPQYLVWSESFCNTTAARERRRGAPLLLGGVRPLWRFELSGCDSKRCRCSVEKVDLKSDYCNHKAGDAVPGSHDILLSTNDIEVQFLACILT